MMQRAGSSACSLHVVKNSRVCYDKEHYKYENGIAYENGNGGDLQ